MIHSPRPGAGHRVGQRLHPRILLGRLHVRPFGEGGLAARGRVWTTATCEHENDDARPIGRACLRWCQAGGATGGAQLSQGGVAGALNVKVPLPAGAPSMAAQVKGADPLIDTFLLFGSP